MPITGLHAILYTSEPEALRAVFRDVLGWPYVDAHDGWLIFGLPPAELGVHPSGTGDSGTTGDADGTTGTGHEVSFMCDDLEATVAELRSKGIVFEGAPEPRGFGTCIDMVLPGGVKVTLYQPRHPTAI